MNGAGSRALSPTASDAAVIQEMARLREENAQLHRRIAWFEKQLFGRKSEKRLVEENAHQASLLGETPPPTKSLDGTITVTYQRGKAKKHRAEDCVNDNGLRFGPEVPVEVIVIEPKELKGADADQFAIIDTKISHRLAQRPASYVVLRYERPVLKRQDTPALITPPAPANVLENTVADVSVLVGLLVDKFQYHLPLYRQHQRIQAAGITLSRATLTAWVKRAIALLTPIVSAQLANVLRSRTLAMDETPIKAGRSGKGKMKAGWFWPLYGEDDEVVFTYSVSRGRQHIEAVLRERFTGTLLSDGYAAYASYVKATDKIQHAQCWAHTRRQFVEAERDDPERVATALAWIGEVYRVEKAIAEQQLTDDKKRDYRLEHGKPAVDGFIQWCQEELNSADLTPQHPVRKAIGYVLNREQQLRVFLEDPSVPVDTNHLERALRPIPMGKKNWMFCWTELGAEHVGIIQSLITTCKLHDINPYTYLTDVLLRIGDHPAKEVGKLTPRLWKENFADNPLRSDLYHAVNNGLK